MNLHCPRRHHQETAALPGEYRVPFVILHCCATEAELLRCLTARTADDSDASEGQLLICTPATPECHDGCMHSMAAHRRHIDHRYSHGTHSWSNFYSTPSITFTIPDIRVANLNAEDHPPGTPYSSHPATGARGNLFPLWSTQNSVSRADRIWRLRSIVDLKIPTSATGCQVYRT
jgi:hypothetical protein